MKTKYLFMAAIGALTLVSCADESFVGDQEALNAAAQADGSIQFVSNTPSMTRALTGADAAKKLDDNFVIEGIKTVSSVTQEVFDNYNVYYIVNSAATTASNTANWEYVNQSILSGKTAVAEQTIKYWDYAASQYDFWAYSLGGGSATVSTLAHDAALGTSAYTITANKEDMAKVYISDLVTAYNPNQTVSTLTNEQATATASTNMGNEVNMSFRSLISKVRVGLYETIPGYSVRNVLFYPSTSGAATEYVKLFASSDVLPTFNPSAPNDATFKVTFDHIGKANIGNSDYNKAHVTRTSSYVTSSVDFGTLSYGAHQDGKHEKTGYTADPSDSWTEIWLQRSSNTCTWAKETSATAGDYSIVLPYETGAVLTLKVDYTLESIDGTGETIVVHGATALVPSQFTQWKPNYAYTYLFKISDNTNGLTNVTVSDKVGLYPITLDAIVVETEEGIQETITTVATPSITTYSKTSDVTTNNEYTTSDDIYVTATEDGTLMNMSSKAILYDITKSSSPFAATEAEVLASLTTYSTLSGGTYTGRNSIVLTPVTDALSLTETSIPLADGNSITGLTAGQVALIDNTKLTTGHYYAYVYDTTTSSSTTDKYEVATVTVGTTPVTSYYTRTGTGTIGDPYVYTLVVAGTNSTAEGKAIADVTYYDKYTVVTGATYAIKVIRIQ